MDRAESTTTTIDEGSREEGAEVFSHTFSPVNSM